MGSKYSLPERIDKDTFIHVTGEFFTEKLWEDFSRHDFIPRGKLLCMEKVHAVLQEDPQATDVYEGGLRCGEKDGYGLYIYRNGDIYDGEWQMGEQHGYGTYFNMSSGDVSSGSWVQGRLTGEGRVVSSSGPLHPGGHGRLVPSVGDVYEGGLKDNKKHGYGKLTYSKTVGECRGQRYEGMWVDDVRHGHGVCLYANGHIYDGAWVNGKRCGPGILTFSNGDVFSGHFFDNVMHGKGTFTPRGRAPEQAEWVRGDRVLPVQEKSPLLSSRKEDEEFDD